MKFNALKGLNKEQLEAVKATEGYIRVIAGAGSGKTRALTHRYMYLVEELGISTANILCVTFTNKAANEMKKRIRSMIGDKDIGFVCTFHGLCKILLMEDIHAINYPDKFIIMDNQDASSLLRIVFEEAGINHRQFTIEKAKERIGLKKKSGKYVDDILNMDTMSLKDKFISSKNIEEKIFYGYLYQQKKAFLLDFNDLINFALYILVHNPEIAYKWQKRMEYIMVDEFQDVNSSNYALVSILSKYHKNLFVVGDPDQTIYSWRGAKVEYILNFDKEYPNCKTLFMNTNYRSTNKIIDVSNSIIDKNRFRIKKGLIPTKKSETQVIYNHSLNQEEESKWIASQIKNITDNHNNYDDITILYRAHYVSRSIEECLIKEKIPYVIYSGVPFYERKEIKDILSYMRMVAFGDDLSFIRVVNEPKRNFGKSRMKILQDFAEQNKCTLYDALKINIDNGLIARSRVDVFVNLIEKYRKIYNEMSVSDLLTALLVESGYEEMLRMGGEEERLDNLSEFKNSISEYELSAGEDTSLEGYLQDIALFTNVDLKNATKKVKLMTIHSAKGLEFPYVFVCGLNEGIFPSVRVKTKEELEEERRLAYVAFTRAEKALFLSESEGYLKNGGITYPSRFIFNIDKNLLKYNAELPIELVDNSRELIESSEVNLYRELSKAQFNKGDCISHDIFGVGIINDIDRNKYSYIIKFNNSQTERTISFDAKLNLVKKNQLTTNNKETIDINNEKNDSISTENYDILCKDSNVENSKINKESILEIEQIKKQLINKYEDLLLTEKEELKLKYEKLMQEQEKKLKNEYDEKIVQENEKITNEHKAILEEKIKLMMKDKEQLNTEIDKLSKEKEQLELKYEKSIKVQSKKLKKEYDNKITEEVNRLTNEHNTILEEKVKEIKLETDRTIKEDTEKLNNEIKELKKYKKFLETQNSHIKIEYDMLISKHESIIQELNYKFKKIILDKIDELNVITNNNKQSIFGGGAAKRKKAIAQIEILKIILDNIVLIK